MHESTAIIEEPSLPHDCYVGHFTQIRPGVRVGRDCSIRAHCFIARCTIGNRVKIMQFTNIGEGTEIGDDVFIGVKVAILNTKRIKHTRNFELVITPVKIERAARIGSYSVIGPGVTIGENALIGMGSVVTRDVPAGECWVGNPARFMRMVPEEELL